MTRSYHSKLVLLCAALGLAAGGCGEESKQQWPITQAELEGREPQKPAFPAGRAEATYSRYCVACHGNDGRGNGGSTGADFTAATSPLTGHSDAELIVSVRDGKQGARAV